MNKIYILSVRFLQYYLFAAILGSINLMLETFQSEVQENVKIYTRSTICAHIYYKEMFQRKYF